MNYALKPPGPDIALLICMFYGVLIGLDLAALFLALYWLK